MKMASQGSPEEREIKEAKERLARLLAMSRRGASEWRNLAPRLRHTKNLAGTHSGMSG